MAVDVQPVCPLQHRPKYSAHAVPVVQLVAPLQVQVAPLLPLGTLKVLFYILNTKLNGFSFFCPVEILKIIIHTACSRAVSSHC